MLDLHTWVPTAVRDRWAWARLDGELGRWRAAGFRPRLWWRDDDAREPTEQLRRLLDLSDRLGAPLALAVIPDIDLQPLFRLIDRHPLVSLVQHGVDHVERTSIGGRGAEFRADAPVHRVRRGIAEGWLRLSRHPRALPVYVPPWNHATPNVIAALETMPHSMISLYGDDSVETDLTILNASVDVMSWRPPRFRGTAPVLARLTRQFRQRRLKQEWWQPVGLLTHHVNHDDETWDFLDLLGDRLEQARANWIPVSDSRAAST